MSQLTIIVVLVAAFLSANVNAAAPETADFGHGLQVLGKIVRQYLNAQAEDVKISDGVHLISTSSENDARAATDDDKSVLGAVENYLRNHELRIKLPELMPAEGFGRAFKDAIDEIEDTKSNDQGSPRGRGGGGGGGKGGGGGGNGGILIVGAMFAKMLAALGLGAVGLLAKKALLVSVLALFLSVIIGLKKLVHHDDHDHGGHHVIHAGHGHGEYRRKRETAQDIAYKAWNAYNKSS